MQLDNTHKICKILMQYNLQSFLHSGPRTFAICSNLSSRAHSTVNSSLCDCLEKFPSYEKKFIQADVQSLISFCASVLSRESTSILLSHTLPAQLHSPSHLCYMQSLPHLTKLARNVAAWPTLPTSCTRQCALCVGHGWRHVQIRTARVCENFFYILQHLKKWCNYCANAMAAIVT